MIETPPFNDGRGRYPDRIAAAAPRGFREYVKQAVHAEGISLGEFVRRAIAEHISRVTEDGCDVR